MLIPGKLYQYNFEGLMYLDALTKIDNVYYEKISFTSLEISKNTILLFLGCNDVYSDRFGMLLKNKYIFLIYRNYIVSKHINPNNDKHYIEIK